MTCNDPWPGSFSPHWSLASLVWPTWATWESPGAQAFLRNPQVDTNTNTNTNTNIIYSIYIYNIDIYDNILWYCTTDLYIHPKELLNKKTSHLSLSSELELAGEQFTNIKVLAEPPRLSFPDGPSNWVNFGCWTDIRLLQNLPKTKLPRKTWVNRGKGDLNRY